VIRSIRAPRERRASCHLHAFETLHGGVLEVLLLAATITPSGAGIAIRPFNERAINDCVLSPYSQQRLTSYDYAASIRTIASGTPSHQKLIAKTPGLNEKISRSSIAILGLITKKGQTHFSNNENAASARRAAYHGWDLDIEHGEKKVQQGFSEMLLRRIRPTLKCTQRRAARSLDFIG